MKARILVVDDTRIWRNSMKRALQHKYEVDTAASYQEALTLLRSAPIPGRRHRHRLIRRRNKHRRHRPAARRESPLPTTMTIAVSGRPATVNKESFAQKYQAITYLEREILSKERETFVAWVDQGVMLSRQAKDEQNPAGPQS